MCLVHWDMKGMYSLTSLRAINPRVNQVCFVPGTMYTTWKYSKDATRGNSFLACLFEKKSSILRWIYWGLRLQFKTIMSVQWDVYNKKNSKHKSYRNLSGKMPTDISNNLVCI